MSISSTFYNTIVKRNSIFVTSIFIATFGFGIGYDVGITTFWDRWNQGRQWKDIRHKYVEAAESE